MQCYFRKYPIHSLVLIEMCGSTEGVLKLHNTVCCAPLSIWTIRFCHEREFQIRSKLSISLKHNTFHELNLIQKEHELSLTSMVKLTMFSDTF
jgi:hypothetical protein